MSNVKLHIHLVIIFSYYLFPFVFSSFPQLCYLITYGLPVFYIFCHKKMFYDLFGTFSKKQFFVVIIIFILLMLSIVEPILHLSYDFSYIAIVFSLFRKILIYIFLAMLILKNYAKEKCVEIFMFYFVISIFCYVIGTCVMVVSPQFKAFWLGIVSNSDNKGLTESFGYVFRTGWMGFSGFRATIKCTLGVIFTSYLFFDKNTRNMKTIIFLILMCSCFIGNMFYGRSGLAVSVIVFLLSLIMYKSISFKQILQIVLLFFAIFLLLFILKDTNELISDWYKWVTVPFINLYKTGSFNNVSADALFQDMLFMPQMKTIIWGDGMYTNPTGGYYMRTDSGVMRNLLFWGVPGAALSYLAVYVSAKNMGKCFKVVTACLMISFTVFEIKGAIYYEFIPLTFVLAQMVIRNRIVYQYERNNYD